MRRVTQDRRQATVAPDNDTGAAMELEVIIDKPQGGLNDEDNRTSKNANERVRVLRLHSGTNQLRTQTDNGNDSRIAQGGVAGIEATQHSDILRNTRITVEPVLVVPVSGRHHHH
jgi:hypothetical protein